SGSRSSSAPACAATAATLSPKPPRSKSFRSCLARSIPPRSIAGAAISTAPIAPRTPSNAVVRSKPPSEKLASRRSTRGMRPLHSVEKRRAEPGQQPGDRLGRRLDPVEGRHQRFDRVAECRHVGQEAGQLQALQTELGKE